MILLVGLGNPGKQYAQTRHNIGFLAIDALANSRGVSFSAAKGETLAARMSVGGQDVLAIKPQSFMNLSGASVQSQMAFHKIPPENVYVIVDDIQLGLGRIRLRSSGSHGGHNGLRDIEARVGRNYNRLRVGVGACPEHWDLADWVLSKFSTSEMQTLEKIFPVLDNCLQTWFVQGLDVAARTFNGLPTA